MSRYSVVPVFFKKRVRGFAACLELAAVLTAVLLSAGRAGPAACAAGDFGPLALEASAADPAAEKVVYLTFDDGPSKNTEAVLDLLKEEGVCASFFVVGAECNEEYLPLLERTRAEGHCIGLHSCSHEYREIYAGEEAFWADMDALLEKLAPYCGDYPFRVLRFPGGTGNTVSRKYGGEGLMERLAQQAAEKGYTVVDWNVSAEDSVGGHPTASTLASRVIRGCKEHSSAVVLMHDSGANKAGVEALPVILRWLKENNYRFDTVDHLPPS